MGTVCRAVELQKPDVQLAGWTAVGSYAGPQAGRWTGHTHTGNLSRYRLSSPSCSPSFDSSHSQIHL